MPRSERLPAHRVLTHLVVMVAVSVVLGVVVAGLAIPFAGLAGVGTQNLADTMDELPQELDHGGAAAAEPRSSTPRATSWPRSTPTAATGSTSRSGNVSRIMVKALVAIEDYRFYEHGPLDFKGTLRAMITNQANDGVVQGGSTITQQLVKLTLIQQADSPEEQAAATDDTYARKFNELRYAIALEEQLHQGLDPRALPQHRLLRRRRLRHPDGGQALLRGQREQAEGQAGRAARRHGQEPHRVRPDQQRGQGDRAAQRRARPDGRAQRDQPGEGRPAQGAGRSGSTSRSRRNGCVRTDGAVLLRLRPRLAVQGPAPRRDPRGADEPAADRRPHHPDHRRRRHAGDGRQRGARARLPAGPGDRRAGGGRARHRQRQGDRPVPADGPQEARRARPTSTTSSRRSSATRSAARPGRRSRSSRSRPRSSRASRSTRLFNAPASMDVQLQRLRQLPRVGAGFGGTFNDRQLDRRAAG